MAAFDLQQELHDCLSLKRTDSPNKVVRGGNSGVLGIDGIVKASDSGSCLRVIFLRAEGIQAPVDFRSHLTFALGYAWESVFSSLEGSEKFKLRSQIPIGPEPIQGSSVPFTGTADFIMDFPNGQSIAVDTKSVSSINSYIDLFQKGKVKTNYVAQLVTYMEFLKLNTGYLAPASFIYAGKGHMTAGTFRDTGGKIEPSMKLIPIQLHGSQIVVNGDPADFNLDDVRRHREAAAFSIETRTISPTRPQSTSGYSVCHFCKFKNACDQFETEYDNSADNFISIVKNKLGGSND